MQTKNYFETLDKNAKEVIHLLESCTLEELQTSLPDSWSILEIAEHILLTEKIVLKLLMLPAEKTIEKTELFGNEKLQKIIVQLRARKVKAPEMLLPKGDIKSSGDFASAINEVRMIFKNAIIEEKIKLDNSVHSHPYLGEMTTQDWLYFIPAHTKRHTEQIKDVLTRIKEGR